jgi:hypothetical protein
MLLTKVTQAWEAAVTTVHVEETAAQEAAAARDNVALHVKDAENWATLAKRVALEKVSRVEAENTVVLASAREDVEGFVRKIVLLEGELAAEHRAREAFERERQKQFEELTLLQT